MGWYPLLKMWRIATYFINLGSITAIEIGQLGGNADSWFYSSNISKVKN